MVGRPAAALNRSMASTSNGARSEMFTWSAPASAYAPTRSTSSSSEPPSTPGLTISAVAPNCCRRLSSVHASPTLTAQRIVAGSRSIASQWRCSTSRLRANAVGRAKATFHPSA